MLVSAVIKAKDEELNIAECIDSLSTLVDEVLVIDDGSTDETATLAKRAGAVVVRGHDHQGVINRLDKQGFERASGRYILRLDADERLTIGLAATLREIAAEGHYAGVRYPRRYYFFGGWLDHGGWFKSEQLGFFRRDSWDREWNCDLHSQVPVRGPILTLPVAVDRCMLHYDYMTVGEFVDRSLLRYAKSEALERLRDGDTFSSATTARRVARRSLGRYLRHRGYKDGARGAVVAGLLGAYEMCVAAYMWDAERMETE